MITGVAFDLDGTLWDATNSIQYSWARHINNTDLSLDLVKSCMGTPAYKIADTLGISEEEFAKIQESELLDLDVIAPRIYDGVQAVLYRLKQMGLQVYIVSSCQKGYIDKFIEHSGLPQYLFDGCFFDGYPCKSKPLNLKYIRESLAGEVLYIGDTARDRDAAKNAGFPFIWASYGFGENITKWGDWVIDDIRQLPAMLRRWGYLDV